MYSNHSSNNISNNSGFDSDNSSTTIAALLRNMQNRRASTPKNVNRKMEEDSQSSNVEIYFAKDDPTAAGQSSKKSAPTATITLANQHVGSSSETPDDDETSGDETADDDTSPSDEEDENVVEDGAVADEQQQQENMQWLEECKFENEKMLAKFLQIENCWSYRGCCNTSQGQKVLYRCNRVKRTSRVQCAAGIYTIEKIIYVNVRDADAEDGEAITTTSSFILYRKSAAHTHDQLQNVVKAKVKDSVKDLIIQQFKDGRKPKKIFYNLLESKDIPLNDTPTHKQVVSIINTFKRSNYGEKPITMRQLSNFVAKHSEQPQSVDEPFIVRYEKSARNVREDKFFRFFVTTSRLLNMASKAAIVHADATHKVTTEKIPLIAVGVTDACNKFHFIGLTLANHEATADYALTFRSLRSGVRQVSGAQIQPTVLVCDADSAIHNAFDMVFYGNGIDDDAPRPYIIIMCYFHVMLNIQTKYKFQSKSNKAPFKDDVYVLHLCDTGTKFDIGCELFVEKWGNAEPEATRLLQKSFFRRNKNWFIGCIPRAPKHNNGLESFNATMKRCQTEHQRQPLKQFLHTALSIVRQRSLEYVKGKEVYQSDIAIDHALMKRGCELDLKFVAGAERADGSVNFYAFRSGMQDTNITLRVVNTYNKAHYKTFAEFSAGAFNIWKITFPKDSTQWKAAICSCPGFGAHFICKHIIAIANSLGLVTNGTPEEDYDDEPLFQLGRGRPKRTSKALVIE